MPSQGWILAVMTVPVRGRCSLLAGAARPLVLGRTAFSFGCDLRDLVLVLPRWIPALGLLPYCKRLLLDYR